MSRKLRKGLQLQVNGDQVLDKEQLFISDLFVRFTQADAAQTIETSYDLEKIVSTKTIGQTEPGPCEGGPQER